jgi:FtsP/CotA-like multicopper oxidase with cupredoxin domain
MTFTRRHILRSAAAGALALGTSSFLPRSPSRAAEGSSPKVLRVVTRTIEVNGKAATVYGLQQPDGTSGLTLTEGDTFAVDLRNELTEPTTIHWHGLTPPWPSDGVADAPEPLLAPGASRFYGFPVGTAGTHWMHAHTLQEQNLLAAPLIVREKAVRDEQEVVVLLHDFCFTPAAELMAKLKGLAGGAPGMQGHGGMQHGSMPMGGMGAMNGMGRSAGMAGPGGHGMPMGHGAMPMDLNDIDYDAYLANDRTLSDPEVVRVEKSGRLRLRIINGATATGFWIDLGQVTGEVVAVDGQPVEPVRASRVPLAMGQRADILVQVPPDGVLPLLALREGARERTGIVLAAAGAPVRKLDVTSDKPAAALDLVFERRLQARNGVQLGAPTRSFSVDLTGTMAGYAWAMASDRPLQVRQGDTVAISMRNHSMMAHPMHLHGHRFRVVELDGRRASGTWRDTLLLPPMAQATIAFEASNPGKWAFHCHHLYHMASGMMDTVAYDNVG